MSQPPLSQRSIYEIIRGCQEEARQTRSEETGFCYELFRRALEEQDSTAWTAIEQQYRRLILSWILARSPGLDSEEADIVAQDTLSKFWHTLSKNPIVVRERFEHVGALLGYLRQCAVTTLLDRRRRAQRQERLQARLQAAEAQASHPATPHNIALERLYHQEQLEHVRHWVETQVKDPQERLVLHLSYSVGMTPAEIADSYPDRFPDVQAVHRIKERVLKRARRALAA